MAEIFNFSDHRKLPPETPSIDSLATKCSLEIQDNWERFARNNRLNDYFIESVPRFALPNGTDYLSNLGALSIIESKIGVKILVSAPGYSGPEQLGWVASFKLNDMHIGTPLMFTEAYARCFNILLFLKLGREMTLHGIPIE